MATFEDNMERYAEVKRFFEPEATQAECEAYAWNVYVEGETRFWRA